jgi:predicted transposase YbfD/YdcC
LSKKTFEYAEKAGAHLIVQVKENQPTLYEKVTRWCRRAKPLSGCRSVDEHKRNRHETRIVGVFDATGAVVGTAWEDHVAAIIQVERTVHKRNPATGLWATSFETSFYLSNRRIKGPHAARKIREHWGIETRQHYVRDVTMAEDASRIRNNPGIFARMRSFAYNILRLNQSDTIAQDRFAAACGGIDYLLTLNYSTPHL